MSVTFPPSTTFQQWMTQLRVSWMGRKAQAIMGAFAKVAGDLTYDWMLRSNLEHMPEYASPVGAGFCASERQIDAGPAETTANLAKRTVQAANIWKYASTPLGMLVALYWAGFPGAVIIQQNGLAFSLNANPVAGADPLSLLVVTPTATLSVALQSSITPSRSIPAGTSWATWDSNTDFCSRFSVLFPGPIFPTYFTTYGTAIFTGVEDGSVLHPWPTATWNNPFPDTSYKISHGAPTITDGSGGVTVAADVQTSKTTTGIKIRASASFTGFVDVLAYQAGANPFADLHPVDLARIKSVISKWRPEKASCLGVYCLVQGKFWDWPVRTLGQAVTWGPSSVVAFTGGF